MRLPIDFTQPRPAVMEQPRLDTKVLLVLSTSMKAELDRAARRRGMSRNALIRVACEKYLDDIRVS